MDIDDVFDVWSVSTGHGDGHWGDAIFEGLENESVSHAKPFFGQSEFSEAVTYERVGAGKIDRKVIRTCIEDLCESLFESGQVLDVLGPVIEIDIEMAGMFAGREISCTVN